jgi:hypothetical protein
MTGLPSIAEREALLAEVLAMAAGDFDAVAQNEPAARELLANQLPSGPPVEPADEPPDPARSQYRDCDWWPR